GAAGRGVQMLLKDARGAVETHSRRGDRTLGVAAAAARRRAARIRIGSARRAGRREDVGGARRLPAVAHLGDVTKTGGRATLRPGRRDPVRRTRPGLAVADLGDVARTARSAALDTVRRERDGGTRGVVTRAGLGDVALAGCGTADDRRRHERVRGTVVDHAVAALGDVALAGRRSADADALHVGGTLIAHAVAALGDVAVAGRRSADAGALQVGRAGVVHAVAGLGGVAEAGRGAADAGPLRVGRAPAAHAGAELGGVARAHGAAALVRRRLERVRRAVAVGAGAGLGDVARSDRGTAHGRLRRRNVEAAGGGVAHVVGARVAVVRAHGVIDLGGPGRAGAVVTEVGVGTGVAVVARRAVGRGVAAAEAAHAAVVDRAGVVVVAGRVLGHDVAAAESGDAAVLGGARVAVVARRPVRDRRATGAEPVLARVGRGARITVVARRALGGLAGAHALRADVVRGARIAVVARGALRLRLSDTGRVLTRVQRRADVVVVARRAVHEERVAGAAALVADVVGGSGVAVVAGLAVEQDRGARAVRAGVVGRAGVAVVAGGAVREVCARRARAEDTGVAGGAGVAVVARGPVGHGRVDATVESGGRVVRIAAIRKTRIEPVALVVRLAGESARCPRAADERGREDDERGDVAEGAHLSAAERLVRSVLERAGRRDLVRGEDRLGALAARAALRVEGERRLQRRMDRRQAQVPEPADGDERDPSGVLPRRLEQDPGDPARGREPPRRSPVRPDGVVPVHLPPALPGDVPEPAGHERVDEAPAETVGHDESDAVRDRVEVGTRGDVERPAERQARHPGAVAGHQHVGVGDDGRRRVRARVARVAHAVLVGVELIGVRRL